MLSKLFISFVFLAILITAGGFIALAVWDVPVAQKTVEKTLDNAQFLEKKS